MVFLRPGTSSFSILDHKVFKELILKQLHTLGNLKTNKKIAPFVLKQEGPIAVCMSSSCTL